MFKLFLKQLRALIAVAVLLIAVVGVADDRSWVMASGLPVQIGSDFDGDDAGDEAGRGVAMSADGSRVAIGAIGDRTNTYGYVRVFEWSGSTWVQMGTDLVGESIGDWFGSSLSLSADGTWLAIGAMASSIGGARTRAGEVQVYRWSGSSWVQVGSSIEGAQAYDMFGKVVKLSADGSRLAVGAPNSDYLGTDRGYVQVLDWNGTSWVPAGSVFNGVANGDLLGWSVSLSADGHRLAMTTWNANSTPAYVGRIQIFEWSGGGWVQLGANIDGQDAFEFLGYAMELSGDGSRVVGGSYGTSAGMADAGYLTVFEWDGTAWVQLGDVIGGEAADDFFGLSVSISHDGSRVAAGAIGADAGGLESGHVRIFDWTGAEWVQVGVAINGEAANDESGSQAVLSTDGARVAIAALGNDAGGAQAGHVRVFGNPPTAPTITGVTPGSGSLRVAFVAAVSPASSVTNYAYSLDGSTYTPMSPAVTTSPLTIGGLINGTNYSVSIKALSAMGDSGTSNTVSGTPVPPSVVAAPTTTSQPVTARPAVNTPEAKQDFPVIGRRGMSFRSIAIRAGVSLPPKAQLRAVVRLSSRRVCRISGSRVVALKSGACVVVLRVIRSNGSQLRVKTTLTASAPRG